VAVLHFGQFTLDPDTGVLARNGIPVRLQPQPARVLALLVARAGEVVSREELRQQIWGTDTFVDFERGVNFCIAQIRSALGDSADSPRYIETLPKRGYRFIAPTSALRATAGEPGTSDSDRTSRSQAAVDQQRTVTQRTIAVAALLLTVIGAGIVMLAIRGNSNFPVRIAVIPFDNETGDTEFDRIAVGVADATVARLATPERLKQVAVIGNAAILRRPRSFRNLREIGQELGAHYVVLAQVKNDKERIRLVAHLIRVADEAHVWADTFDREAFGLDVQAELAEAIAQSVVANAR
jgi:DNA-binding winged helix-turn-helix (wHTH) protein/TolB-like protein